ncbi:MAG TPA: gas vesicle protein [Trebonia sp.]
MAERRRSAKDPEHDEAERDEAERDEAEDEPEDELDEPEDELDEPEEPEDEREEFEDELEEPEDEPEEPRRNRSKRDGAGDGARRLSAAQAGRAGLRQITELTGKQPEGVTGVRRSEDGWLVTVEVVEDRRIPSSTDILSTYETEVDGDGELMAYRRVRRYSRGHGDDGDS